MKDNKPTNSGAEALEEIRQGVKNIYESDGYRAWLDCNEKFSEYSLGNQILIAMQKPEATRVAGYVSWQKKFNRNVRKGEKGIRIIAPVPHKKTVKETVLDSNGKEREEEREVSWKTYRAVYVWDVSQTDGDPLPEAEEFVHSLTGDVEGYDRIMAALADLSPAPISFGEIEGTANGSFAPASNEIEVRAGMPQAMTIKTTIHEIAHARLHNAAETIKQGKAAPDPAAREIQAESVAYVICRHLGLDTSDYSFGYVALWGGDKTEEERTANLEAVREETAAMISGLDHALEEKKTA